MGFDRETDDLVDVAADGCGLHICLAFSNVVCGACDAAAEHGDSVISHETRRRGMLVTDTDYVHMGSALTL